MEFKEKVLLWAKRIGFVGLLYVPAAIICWLLGIAWLGWMCLGAFVYANLNVIWKLITGLYYKI